MGVQDREWYQRSWDKRVQEYGGDFSIESQPKHNGTKKEKLLQKRNPQVQELSTYRTVYCKKCKEKLYVHSPSKIDANGFVFRCSFCGTDNTIFEKGSSGKLIIKWLLAITIILFLLIIVLNALTYFKLISDDVLISYPYLRYFVFLP